ncbi:MAG TPA: sugar kinase [Ruminococcaceae bacterium]|nr:sugar kinase [Oscillospiraceae bacterium]
MKKYMLGFDIGGTKCAVVLGECDGNGGKCRIEDKIRFETDSKRGWRAVVEQLLSSAEEIISRNGRKAEEFIGCGISCGGPLDSKKGIILSPPNLPDWDHVELVRMTQERLGIPTRLQNDANACALAEWHFGAGQGSTNMVFLTFGTGMGAGLVLNGRLYSGTNDNAGEVGHIRLSEDGPLGYGKNGSFEGFCSGGGIARLAKQIVLSEQEKGIIPSFFDETIGWDSVTAKSVAEAAKQGDETAVKIYDVCGEYLGRGLSILIDILNPDTIVIGSIFERSSALLLKKMNEFIRREALDGAAGVCKIVPASLGDSIGDYAALGVAMMTE